MKTDVSLHAPACLGLGEPDMPLQSTVCSAPEDIEMLERIDAALERLNDGVFGFCMGCGSQIATALLEADPARTKCKTCAD